MSNALKDLFGPMLESMLKGEINHHLGYDSNDKNFKETDNRRNGYGKKKVKSSQGELEIQVPRDRNGSFDPVIVPNRQRDISSIEDKVIAMYAGECHKEIFQLLLKIFMDLVYHMK